MYISKENMICSPIISLLFKSKLPFIQWLSGAFLKTVGPCWNTAGQDSLLTGICELCP